MLPLRRLAFTLLAGSLIPLNSASSQPNSASNALALSIISAWQNSSRAPTPEAEGTKDRRGARPGGSSQPLAVP